MPIHYNLLLLLCGAFRIVGCVLFAGIAAAFASDGRCISFLFIRWGGVGWSGGITSGFVTFQVD
jgi:hypothetical protein